MSSLRTYAVPCTLIFPLDYDHSLKKPVCSRYGEGMFTRYPRKDGTVYNVNVSIKPGVGAILRKTNSHLAG